MRNYLAHENARGKPDSAGGLVPVKPDHTNSAIGLPPSIMGTGRPPWSL